MKWFKGSIYSRILFIFTTILLLVGGFVSVIYMQGVTLIKDEVTQMMDEQNKNMVRNIQNQCRQLRLMEYQFVDFNQVTELILAKSYGEPDRVRDVVSKIQEGLLTIWQGNSLVQEVFVVVPGMDMVIQTGYYGPIKAEQETLISACGETPSGTLTEYDGSVILFSDEKAPLYYVYLNVDQKVLESLLGDSNREKTGINVLYNKKTGSFLGTAIPEAAQQIIRGEGVISGKIVEQGGYVFTAAKVHNTQYLGITIAKRQSIYGDMNVYRIFYIIILGTLVVSGVWFWRKMFVMVHYPMQVLVTGLNNVTSGNLKEQITCRRQDEFQYIYDSFNNMTARLNAVVDKNARQELLLQKAQLKQLQAQIAPHFFYNSFITLSNRIEAEDYEFAAEFSKELGRYFMFVTRSGREYLPLKEELNHAATYMNIQKIRFRSRIAATAEDLKEQYQEIQVPRLILQPVIENVFKYVVEKSRTPVQLRLCFAERADGLNIIIENSGHLEDSQIEAINRQLEQTQEEIHALANIHQRLRLGYPDKGGLKISRSSLGGLQVTVCIQNRMPKGQQEGGKA